MSLYSFGTDSDSSMCVVKIDPITVPLVYSEGIQLHLGREWGMGVELVCCMCL